MDRVQRERDGIRRKQNWGRATTLTHRVRGARTTTGSPLSEETYTRRSISRLYAISPIIRLLDRVDLVSVAISSTPGDAAKGYIEGERIAVRVTFTEAVSASGAVFVPISVGGRVERAVYASGSGTASLDFEYIVQRGDIDTNGVSLCTDTLFDRTCGNIQLNGGSLGATSDNIRPARELPELDDQAEHKVDAAAPFVPNPNVGPEANPSMGIVSPSSAVRPAGVARGEKFRVLFLTSTKRDATSAAIADYNTHVKNAAAAGHADVRVYSSGFRAVASTETVDARDNAALTGTGEKIFWLNGAQVADNYADFLDGSWDSLSAKNQAGANAAGSGTIVWTGSTDDRRGEVLHRRHGLARARRGGLQRSRRRRRHQRLERLATGGRDHRTHGEQTAVRHLPGAARGRCRAAGNCIDASSVRSGGHLPHRRNNQGQLRVHRTGRSARNAEAEDEPLESRSGPDGLRVGVGNRHADIRIHGRPGGHKQPNGSRLRQADEIIELDGADIRAVADNAPVNVGSDCATNWGRVHKVNAQRPTVRGASVTSTPASGGTYRAGETITVALAMNEDVRVTGAPSVMLDVGGAPRRMTYTGPIGTSTRTLSFNYTVVTADFDSDGVSVCSKGRQCGAITLNGGSIRAAHGGLDANLRHPSQDAQGAHKVGYTTQISCPARVAVPSNWALKPSGIDTGGRFRLMFITTQTRNGRSSNIADYNSFVQDRAGAGHTNIQTYKSGFRALASTTTVDARDNTCTTGTGRGDLLVERPESGRQQRRPLRRQLGQCQRKTLGEWGEHSQSVFVWTGSTADGTKDEGYALGNSLAQGYNYQRHWATEWGGPLYCGTRPAVEQAPATATGGCTACRRSLS